MFVKRIVSVFAVGSIAIGVAYASEDGRAYKAQQESASLTATLQATKKQTLISFDDGQGQADSSAGTYAIAKTVSCVNGLNRIRKKVCRYSLVGPEGMDVVPGSLSLDGSGYDGRFTQVNGNEIDFALVKRGRGKTEITVRADFAYAPSQLTQAQTANAAQ